MDDEINRIDLILFFFWILYYMPLAVSRSFGALQDLFILMRFPVVLIAVYYCYSNWVVNGTRICNFWIFASILFIWNGICVFVNGPNEIRGYLSDLYRIVEMVAVLYYSYDKKGERGTRPLYYAALIYIYANFLSVMLFPQGMFVSSIGSVRERVQWLFGSKNNMPIYMTLFSFTTLIQERKSTASKIFAFITILIACITTASAGETGREFLAGSSTGMVTSLIALITCAYLLIPDEKVKTKHALLNMKRILIIVGALNLIFLGGISIPIINSIVINVMGKNLTFTNRVFVWENALDYIRRSPLIGHGVETVVFYKNGATSTYNIFLGIIKSYGIPSVIFFVICLLMVPISKSKNYQILLAGLFAVFINGLMSQIDIRFVMFFVVSLILTYRVDKEELYGKLQR